MNKPPQTPPKSLLNLYTMGSKIPISYLYSDNSTPNKTEWTNNFINNFVNTLTIKNIKTKKITKKYSPYGTVTSEDLLLAFEKYNIKNMNVAVIGSLTPWIEAILLNLNNTVTTIEYGVDTEKEYLNGRLQFKVVILWIRMAI